MPAARPVIGFLPLRYVLACGCLALASEAAAQLPAPTLQFVEVATQLGIDVVTLTGDGSNDYILEANGNGAAIADYDGDGDLDVLVISGSTLERLRERGGDPMATLYRNDGDQGFRDVTAQAGLRAVGWGMGACVGDVNGDALPDLYVTAYGPNLLFRNRGDGTFVEVAAAAGVADPGWSHSCAFGDLDGDADLDLYVANYVDFDAARIPPRGAQGPCGYLGWSVFCGPLGLTAQEDGLYRNRGDGTFVEVGPPDLPDLEPRYGMGVVLADLDGDDRLDIYVGNDSQPNFLVRNLGGGRFEEVGLLAGLALSERGTAQASMGIAAGDCENDGDLDLFVTNFSQDYNTLYRNHGAGFFSDVSAPAGVAAPSMSLLGWGTVFADFDHDGRRDLFVANGHVFDDIDASGLGSTYLQPHQLYRNVGGCRFEEASEELGADLTKPRPSRGAAAGDLDGDGDLDLVVVNINALAEVLRNEGGNARPWLLARLRPAAGQGDPVGARLELGAGGTRQFAEVTGGGSYLSHSDQSVHFGLGAAPGVERLDVRWPSGRRVAFEALPAGFLYVVPDASPEENSDVQAR